MESGVRKSLLGPIKTLKYCVFGEKTQDNWTNYRSKLASKGRTSTPSVSHLQDLHLLRSYQADLERERKLRKALNVQKNAERAAMRSHFRRKYQLSENSKDTDHLQAVGGKVVLPQQLAKMVCPEDPAKEDSFTLLSAFQGLSFNGGTFTGNKQTKTPTTANTEPCKVM